MAAENPAFENEVQETGRSNEIQETVNTSPYPGPYQPLMLSQQPGPSPAIVREYDGPTPRPYDYIGVAVFITCCCCSPCGILALIYSYVSHKSTEKGDYERAVQTSEIAKQFSIAGLGIGIVGWVIGFFILIAYLISGVAVNNYLY